MTNNSISLNFAGDGTNLRSHTK